jgi:hypothetical protein
VEKGEKKMRNVMKKSGLALVLAAGCCGMATDAKACSGPQNTAKMTPAYKMNMALAKLRVLPDQADLSAQKKPEDVQAYPPSVVGLWDVKFFAQGQQIYEIYDLWHADGTEIEVDASNPINGNVCNGVYRQTDTFSYRLTHPSWNFDNSGNFIGQVMLYETITLDPLGNSYTGTETVDVYDVNGNLIDHEDGITITATRIKPV